MKWLKIIDGKKEINVTEKYGLQLLNTNVSFPEEQSNSVEINGVDGVLPGAISFAPFSLELEMIYIGIDKVDYQLFTHNIRSLFNRRNPYYIIHSDLPGVKYAVNGVKVSFERIYTNNLKMNIECSVYKGFSESVNTTDDEFLFESNWMFDNGIPLDFTPKYQHETNQFTIWNGSTDTIDPRNLHHQLQILLNVNATNGFELVNYTTGDVFKYNKSISSNVDFVLSGIHAYRDQNKVGIDTNRGVITLAPGKNEFKIKGDVTSQKVLFKFPFIYR